MSSRAAGAQRGGEGGAAGTTDHLWAKVAELERDFAGYKRRLAERRAQAAAEVAGDHAGEEERRDDDAAGGRGRRYEEYVRKRDERLRQEWRSRMERKEAEMQELWARLDRSGSRGQRAGAGDGELAATGHAREVISSSNAFPTLSLYFLAVSADIDLFSHLKAPFALLCISFLVANFYCQMIGFLFLLFSCSGTEKVKNGIEIDHYLFCIPFWKMQLTTVKFPASS